VGVEQVNDPGQETFGTDAACLCRGAQQQRIARNRHHGVDAAEQRDHEPGIGNRRRLTPARQRASLPGFVHSLDQALHQAGPTRLTTGQRQPEYQAGSAAVGVGLPEQGAQALQVEPVDVPGFQDCVDIGQQPFCGEPPNRIDQSLPAAKMIVQGRAGHAEIGRDMLDPHAVGPIFDQTPFGSLQNGKFCGVGSTPDAFRRSACHQSIPA
jgi:hypothetical protein